jgi:hypothetical protein
MISKSPERGTFQIETQLKSVEEGTTTSEQAQEMIDFYRTWQQRRDELEATDEWKIDNMEYDLRSTQWIVDKVKSDDVYAQHLYAAMCNRDFTKNDVIPILTEKRWSCSWRSAGGIIANMQEKGDYIDWYCSGIRNNDDLDDDQFRQLTKEQQEFHLKIKAYVSESVVTDEIRSDLLKLGWIVIDDDETY